MQSALVPAISCLQEAVDRLVAEFHPLRILVFGSHARGDAQPDSDLDLLVVLSTMTDKRAAAAAMLRALRGISAAIEVIPTDQAEIQRRCDLPGDVLRSALRDGKVVYERRP